VITSSRGTTIRTSGKPNKGATGHRKRGYHLGNHWTSYGKTTGAHRGGRGRIGNLHNKTDEDEGRKKEGETK